MTLTKSLWTKLITIGLGATMAFGVGLTASKVAEGVQAATTVTVGNDFSAVSGNIDAKFAYTSFKGGAGTAPAVNGGDIRLYQNGGYITVSPRVANYKMTSLTIANSGNSDGKGPFTAWYLLSGNFNDTDPSSMTSTGSNSWTSNAYTYSNPSGFTHFKLVATGTSSSTRVYVDSISITYDYFGAGTVDVTGVTISEGASINIYEGSTQQLTAVVAPADATDKTVSWTSNNPTKASVNSSGLVSALSVGSAIITVTTTDGGFTDTITVTVTAVVLNSITIKTPATQTTFPFGSDFNYAGLVITANYNSGPVDKNSDFAVTGVDTMVLGEQTATVTFGGKTASYSVIVSNQNSTAGVINYATDLIISEYIEGSGSNKYIELYNGTGSSKNLTDYELRLYSNGSQTASSTVVLSGTISHGSTVVYKQSSATLTLPTGVTATTNAAVNFNGDDAVALAKKSSGPIVDLIGEIGEDPGSGWSNNGVSTLDKTLVRKPSVTHGVLTSPTAFDPSLEWDALPIDTVSNLGSHTMNLGDSITAEQQVSAFVDYVMAYGDSAKGRCVAVFNQLNTEYGFMSSGAKTIFDGYAADASETAPLSQQAKARFVYLAAYAAANPAGTTSLSTRLDNHKTALIAIVIIGLIGLSTVAGFYFLKKKKETF